jgi:dipeptidyl-peptidase-4
MRPFAPVLLVAASVLCVTPSSPGQDRRLGLEQTVGRGKPVDLGGELESWRWAEDGEHLVTGKGEQERWIDPASGREVERRADAEVEVQGQEEAAPAGHEHEAGDEHEEEDGSNSALNAVERDFVALEELDERAARRIARSRKQVCEHGRSLFRSKGELYFHDPESGARILTRDSEPEIELSELSPDGLHVAFVQGNDLIIVNTGNSERRAVTEDGGADVLNGKLDWVYQEEIYGRGDFKAFWWSPDSRHIAFLRLDEAGVHDFTVVDFVEKGHFRVESEVTRYPKVGDPNPEVALGIVDVRDGAVVWADLDGYREVEPLIVRVDWTPDGVFADTHRLLFMVQDRIQTWLELGLADPRTGEWKSLLREESDSWVERADAPRWLADGSFLWLSDRSGYRHLYRYRKNGELVGAVTGGDWALRDVLALDEARERLWFTSTQGGAVNANVYRIGLDGKGLRRLTQGEGTHAIDFDAERRFFIDRVSSLSSPTELRLCDAEGEIVRVLARANSPDAEEYALGKWELEEVRARDGFPMDVALLRPVPFDPAQAHPVWLSTYSGPDAPSVRNRWNTSAWYQFLAQNGVIVLQVNVRSASGKGHWATESCYRRLGVMELSDIEDAVRWLVAHPWADAERVGITGYSYGGFMTAYALTHSDLFALGIAGGGVYDWRMYDTIYTERYMSTPELNPEGYAETSVLQAAGRLQGRLILEHSTMDDNVHMQNAMQLAYALQKAGRPFELMLYPQNRHGVRDSDQRWFSRRLEWQAIQDSLLARNPRAAWPEEPTEAEAGSESESAAAGSR